MKKRLSKALAAAGVASRRACEDIITAGRVAVNGEVIRIPQTLVDWEKDRITVDQKPLSQEESKVYFVLNKPTGYLCTAVRPLKNSKIVIDFFSHMPYRLFTVGRLDRETSGLIIVTNDGHFANRIMHPSFNVSKEYLAKTGQEITIEHLETISAGCMIDGVLTKPLSVKKVRRGTLKVTVAEGKKHEVRLLLEHAGLTIRELIRIRIGSITLSTLPLGKYRELRLEEIEEYAPS